MIRAWLPPRPAGSLMTGTTVNRPAASVFPDSYYLAVDNSVISTLYYSDGSAWYQVGRPILTGAQTYYVRTDGSDSNNGYANTAGGAFLTIQKAIDVAGALDNEGYDITIQVADGTYTGANTLKSFVGSGSIIIQGNSGTPANVIISTTSATCFSASSVQGSYTIKDMRLKTTTTGYCLNIGGAPSKVSFSNLDFNTCAWTHIAAAQSAVVNASGNYSITGAPGIYHAQATSLGFLNISTVTITITGTPAWGVAFGEAEYLGFLDAFSNTFSGSATGTRYSAVGNGVIFTNGGGANYFPGNAAGSTATGGQYI